MCRLDNWKEEQPVKTEERNKMTLRRDNKKAEMKNTHTFRSEIYLKNCVRISQKLFVTLFVCFCVLGIAPVFGSSRGGDHTENSDDQTLKSSGRVNPSTLGMELSIPLGSYPGRGVNVPVSISYSSKVWR